MSAMGGKRGSGVAYFAAPSHRLSMPFSISKQADWTSDRTLLGQLEGAAEPTSWFGFLPDFHDATIRSMTFEKLGGVLVLYAFRMTTEVDEQGFFVLDCNPLTTALQLGVRRLAPEHLPILNTSAAVGDYEVGFDDVCGGSGAIYAKAIKLSVAPELN